MPDGDDSLIDTRLLRTPFSIRKYKVRSGDDLATIACRQMDGMEDREILYRHNHSIGIIMNRDELHQGMEIEIPNYKWVEFDDIEKKKIGFR